VNNILRFREYQRGKYHCTVYPLFDWFGLVCFANKNKKCQLSIQLIKAWVSQGILTAGKGSAHLTSLY
jgi:hypothetical protein